MAYAALTSLLYTLEQLLKPNQSLVCTEHLQSLYHNLSHLQLFLQDTTTNDIQTLKVIERRIRDIVYKAEDKVDSSLRRIILADSTENRERASELFKEELLKVEEDVHSLRKEVMQIEFNKHGSRSTELATPSLSSQDKSTIVGMEDEFNTILDCLTSQTEELTVIPIYGMGGIGKTTLARKVYDDSYIRYRFDKHAWVTISEEYNERQMLLEVVSSIVTGSNQEMSNDDLMDFVNKGLKGRRFLIVIDDIWSTEAWDQMQRIFPNNDNKSRILLTTRLKYVADYVSCPGFLPHCKSFLSFDDSWNLFTEKVFNKDPCPPHLEETGKHIVKQCQGLPLSVAVVAGLVGKMEPAHDNWKRVEENLKSLFGTVSEQCQSILSLSYNYLPQYLRACFLYVGGFPEDAEIDVSKLIRLWIAEQFIKARSNKRLELVAEEYLQELIDRSLILTGRQRVNGRMITCKIHDLLRQLCLREAHTENVVHIINTNVSEATYDQRRVILLPDLLENQLFLETLKVTEKRIRDVVYKAEDKVDSSLRSIILEDCTENRERACELFEEELVKVEEDVHSLRKEVMQIELNKHGSRSTELATPSLSSQDKSEVEENTVVGMEDDFNTILDYLTDQAKELTVIPILGMGGIGKTTLARKVYDDSYIRSRFDKHAWVTISREYNERKMLLGLVSSITTRSNQEKSNQEMSNDELMDFVKKGLKGWRFLIVIDDIWSTEAWYQMRRIFPDDKNKSRILLTTRLNVVAHNVSRVFSPHCKSFLSLEDSWNLFTKKAFKKDPCPPHLEEIVMHIVQQCQGLPLSIVVVAGLVGNMEPTHDNWKRVEENLNSFFDTEYEQCESILSLSYSYLPQHLRACFLYVGGLPEDTEIDVSKLISVWIAEQFIKARSNKRLELVAEEYLQELIDRSLILTGRQRVNGRMITCTVHDLLRQLCRVEAHTENVVHIMNRHSSGIIRTFISMGSFSSDFPKGIFSIVSQLKLLKVLDVLSVEYDFSSVIPQLVHLRYVAANIKEALSLAKLRNLQTIILKYFGTEQIPVDIWTVSEIRYVDIKWPLYICNPPEAEKSLFLNNLQILHLYRSSVAEIIRRTPNLNELSINVDVKLIILDGDKTGYFGSLNLLEKLETLYLRGDGTIDRMIFSPNLKELRLSNIKMPWEVVNLLANHLPNLEVLQGCDAFDGTDWKLDEDVVFRKLKYLLIIGGDLQGWEVGNDNFLMLEQLVLCELYHLEEIPESIGEIMTLKLIQIYNCSSALENSAKRFQQEQESLGNYDLQVRAGRFEYFSYHRLLNLELV